MLSFWVLTLCYFGRIIWCFKPSCFSLRATSEESMRTHTHTHTHTHMHTRTQEHIHIHTCMRMHTNTHTHTHTHRTALLPTHTHTHTYTRAHLEKTKCNIRWSSEILEVSSCSNPKHPTVN
jgi:hypothetical protein